MVRSVHGIGFLSGNWLLRADLSRIGGRVQLRQVAVFKKNLWFLALWFDVFSDQYKLELWLSV